MYIIHLPQGCSLRDPEYPEMTFYYGGPAVDKSIHDPNETFTIMTKNGPFTIGYLTERRDQFTDRWINTRVPIGYELPPGQSL